MIDNVVPKDKWEFDANVAGCFEDMLTRSIPQYTVMRDSVANLTRDVITLAHKDNFTILDMGCSDGLMLEKIRTTMDNNGTYVGVDVSEPMLQKAKIRFLDAIINHEVSISNCDLRVDFPNTGYYDVIVSALTLQFIPIEYRQSVLQKVYNNLSNRFGTFIMVEKVLGNNDTLNKLFVKNYYDMKSSNGYSQEQIDRKRLSLEGVLVPVTSDWNIDLLRQAGFTQIDVFWRWMNFVGYIAIK